VRVFLFGLFMKKFLLSLLFCSCVSAQVSDVEVIQNLQEEIVSEKSKNSEELQRILEKYFNDGCRVIVNNEEIVLKKEYFPQYAKIGAMFVPKRYRKLEIPKSVLNENLKNASGKVSTYLNMLDKIKIDFALKNEKISEVSCKDVPMNFKQSLMLKGIFNLLRGADKS